MTAQADIIQMRNIDGKSQYPITTSKAIGMSDGSGNLDKAIGNLQSQIDDILAGKVSLHASASPDAFFEGTQTSCTIKGYFTGAKGKITIKKGGSVLGTSVGDVDKLEVKDTISSTASYSIVGVFKGHEYNASKTVYGVYPMYVGAGATYNDVVSEEYKQTVRRSPSGTYKVTIKSEGHYVFFVVPDSMTIKKVTMSEQSYPLKPATTQQINGTTYKVYQSANPMQAVTQTLVVS